ncbi:hypothetical protein B5K08_32155 [Rhizobium leguminosarum bv. trifolii]|uniref:Transmembrane protein n=1 Tax=Rhizobium leguminosarum bv. trifolii TaxID=386 RepID=A0A3E1AZF7_RHILT|nr:hypothetical protein [Rhizobium leguminosarum]RFB82350.1 hypothetical protein B5K10_32150 [Rhizobium leguminosarum bv. trifolii]RFB82854.1 hypothetical protein B5K08_32155 [Rhizobium leguminosarum bv. trifolii]
MRVRIICVLILSIAFALVMPVVMEFGRALYVDDDFGAPASPDLVFLTVSVIPGILAAAGLWLADVRQRRLPLLALPLGIIMSIGVGYGSTVLAFHYATARYDILTNDCYYTNALAFQGRTGIFVSWGGRTAFHPLEKVRSMILVPAGT